MKNRLYFLDNLRTFLIFLVVLLHAGIVYETILESTWIVSDPIKNSSIGLIRMYLDLFIMFTLFFISGYFVPQSLKRNSTKGFILSKFKRIMIPWIIAVLTLIPAYKAIFLYSRGLPQEEWYTYFHVFQRTGSDLSFFGNNPTQNWLWFLPVLFLFQVVYLILSKTNIFSIKISLKTGVILTFAFSLLYSMVISSLDLTGWYHSALLHFQNERFLIYFMVFLLGSLCYKLKVFDSENKNKKYFIISNVVLTIALSVYTVVALNLFFNMIDPERNYFFVSESIDKLVYHISLLLSMLSFLHIFIYSFRFSLNKNYNIMAHLNKNSYQVYIIHVVIMGLIALFMLDLTWPAFAKYFTLAIMTFVVSNLLISAYKYLIHFKHASRIIKVSTLVAVVLVVVFLGMNKRNTTEKELPVVATNASISQPEVGLHMAVIQGNLNAIRQHIENGSDLNITEPSGGSSPLITAAVFGKTEAANLLIQAGADVNFRNNEGSTALHTAAFFCYPEIVQSLLDNGADKSIKNNNGSTALDSVTVPYEAVSGIYDYFGKTLGPLGLSLDMDFIKKTRPEIAEILQ